MEYVLSSQTHNAIVERAYLMRGYDQDEAVQATRLCHLAAWHGIKTHNAIKALHLDNDLGSGNKEHPGCVPQAKIEKLPCAYEACQKWNAHRKLGQAVAYEAIDTAMKMADRYGVGTISVDQAFHYQWGGGYVMEAAKAGYIAYTNCTAARSEVVPFLGKSPTLGTNPHSWGFPTTEVVGFPIVIDWASSVIAMGRVRQLERESKPLPQGAAVDKDGKPTTDPRAVAALLPFGDHKGYGLALIDELVSALIGGSLPTLRTQPPSQWPGLGVRPDAKEKTTATFFFQVMVPDALDCGNFACGRDQKENLKAVIADILGHGNDGCLLPGQIEAEAAERSTAAGGLILTEPDNEAFKQLADETGVPFESTPCPQ